MAKSKILVFGDSCIDEAAFCEVKRLEPSCGVPVLDILNKTSNPGMAGNLAKNIEYLGAECKFITNANWQNITKTRLYEDKTNHFYLRFDQTQPVQRIQNLKKIRFKNYDAVIVSDYNKGFLTEEDIEFIGNSHPLTFIDTKKILGTWVKPFTFIKINRGEFKVSERQILEFGLQDRIVETLGELGCRYRDIIYPVKRVEIRNLVGAGDSFLAALVVKYCETENISKSIKFANEISTNVVQKKGIGLYSKN